jgi:ABC-type dipeptide/oligopeptide/nickel transport system permease subunit
VRTAPARVATRRRLEGRTPLRSAWRRFRVDRAAMTSLAVLAAIVIFSLAAPLIARWTGHTYHGTYPKAGVDEFGRPVGPGGEFWLGADGLGRDLLVRAAYGGRISLLVGVAATAIATVLGVTIGMISGYVGGTVDTVLSRFLEIVISFPYVLIAIVLATTFPPTSVVGSMALTILVISFFSSAVMARIVRGQVLSLKEREFVEAARALGAGRGRIMRGELLPNLVAPVTVLASLLLPTSIVSEATLSFLGVGVQPPTPSWGGMLNEATDVYRVVWWPLLVPGLLLLLTTLAFNIVGDSVRDAVDPRRDRPSAVGRRS